ncbi:MAG: DUF2889 domain-containing protein [Alphaproteobacteria bacterium]|nr:DUF2889 domain-containing protein [Alphaproteobacteria bacterium]
MPLSPPEPREHIHTRDIACTGYRREDGLWDIEGHLTDTKTYPFSNDERGEIGPGVPVHEMWIRLTVTDDLEIKDVEAVTDFSPFTICREIAPNFKRLIGLRMGPGWRKKALAKIGGVEGCTHIVELLGPVATTAFQTIMPIKNREQVEPKTQSNKAPRLLNTCHAFRSDGPKAKQFWPKFYDGPEA